MIELRIGLAALFLGVVAFAFKKRLYLAKHWRHYLILGLLSAALPFLSYGFAAGDLTASLMSIINATTPVFGTVISAIYFRKKLAKETLIGLMLGIVGVAVIVGFDTELFKTDAWVSVLIVLGAPLCYGLSSTFTQVSKGVEPLPNAYGTMLMGTLILLPMLMFYKPLAEPSIEISFAVLMLGVVCTGVAYLIFFKLLNEIGTSSTLTVTFLVPVFGVLWGVLFLDESVGWHTLAGTILVLAGTIKTTGFSFKKAGSSAT
jgi:drug/metabolite transporter (DMT)-like permease